MRAALQLLVPVVLNAVFWGGISRLIGARHTSTGIDRMFTTLVAGFSVIVLSLELLGLAHQINLFTVALICLAAGLIGLWVRPFSPGLRRRDPRMSGFPGSAL